MNVNAKWVVATVVAVGGLTAGAYLLGAKQAGTAGTATAAPNGKAAPQAPQGDGYSGTLTPNPNSRFTHFRVGNKNVKKIFADGDVIWIGTSGGVIRYDTKTDQWKLFDNTNALLSNGVFHISRLDGQMLIGTYGGGMSLLDEKTGKWTNYNVPNGMGDAFVYDVLRTSNGDTWVATWSGANRIAPGGLNDRSKWDLHTVENTNGGLINDWVYGLAEGRNGEVWMATEGGLVRYKNGKWDNWNHAKGLGAPYEKVKDQNQFDTDPAKMSSHHAKQKKEMGLEQTQGAYNPNYIVSLAVDRDGSVWAGTWGGGLSHFKDNKWTTYTVSEGLPANHVFMLHFDPKGELWIGTSNGLARMVDGKVKSVYGEQHGLFASNVFSMATAADGNRWIGSFGGVTQIRLD